MSHFKYFLGRRWTTEDIPVAAHVAARLFRQKSEPQLSFRFVDLMACACDLSELRRIARFVRIVDEEFRKVPGVKTKGTINWAIDGTAYRVWINEDVNAHEGLFTYAHEIGHAVLIASGWNYPPLWANRETPAEKEAYDDVELFCDEFAAALLKTAPP